jgi:curved DNA-binding protein CbpA
VECKVANDVDMAAVPRVVPGLNLASLALSQEEGFLFSRVDGSATVDQLVRASGMATGQAVGILKSLCEKGIISWDGAPVSEESKDPYAGANFDPFELAEEVDLDEDSKKRILFLHANFDKMTHYEILQVGRRADPKEIKKAYFHVSKEFHPDSYFRKNLGSYASKIEFLFKQISASYEVLSNEQKKRAYDATLPYEPTPEEIEEDKRAERRANSDQRLKEERRQRLLRRTPIARQKAKARLHLEEAKKADEEGDVLAASNSAKLAMTLDPDNEEIKALHDKVAPKAGELRGMREYKRGQGEESMGRQEEALAAYLRSIEANPEDSRPLHRAAALLLEFKRDLRQAVTFCRMAKQLDPDNTKILLTLGKTYMAMEMHKNALRELMQYVESNPLDDHAADLVKQLKKKK